ncbi:hypothetical protein SUGI_0399330 [Cryptomeria japonica]|nr:hypothetical protein SUGI_0399330 [Cryptomeria japonica]
MNYGLLEDYWSKQDSRNADHEDEPRNRYAKMEYPPYPSNPLIKQYSAEYWLLADLLSPSNGLAQRVGRPEDADVIFVPFFATLSAEMQLDRGKAKFRHKTQQNADYLRQRKVLDLIKSSPAWKASHGRDHVFVLTDPVAMWHVREEISSALLLVVDFGGWYMEDSKASSDDATGMIQHTQVSLLKDVIIPYTHLLPTLNISEDHPRETLLYFKGARHRHRGGLVRDKLWSLLDKEPHFVIEEGFPNSMGREQSIQGMRNAGFCLHPAGDTPTSCRLFDAIASLCIPVIISDNIELPFEGMIDYTKFSVFVSVHDALQPKWLVNHLKAISATQRRKMRENMAQVQHIFEYENNYPGGIGPAVRDGAVSHIWKKILFKVPSIKEMIVREWRKPNGSHIPVRCHCT